MNKYVISLLSCQIFQVTCAQGPWRFDNLSLTLVSEEIWSFKGHTPLHSEGMIICYHFSKVMIITIHHEGEGKSIGKITWIQCKSMKIYLMNYYILCLLMMWSKLHYLISGFKITNRLDMYKKSISLNASRQVCGQQSKSLFSCENKIVISSILPNTLYFALKSFGHIFKNINHSNDVVVLNNEMNVIFVNYKEEIV